MAVPLSQQKVTHSAPFCRKKTCVGHTHTHMHAPFIYCIDGMPMLNGQVICGGEHGKGLHQLSYPRGLVLEPATWWKPA